jgi:hypothetical protein
MLDTSAIEARLERRACRTLIERDVRDLIDENERFRKAIEAFGNDGIFDWNVLGRIDELEAEVERLQAENNRLQRLIHFAQERALGG